MYNHNKAQQSKNRVHISWDILYNMRHQQVRLRLLHPNIYSNGSHLVVFGLVRYLNQGMYGTLVVIARATITAPYIILNSSHLIGYSYMSIKGP